MKDVTKQHHLHNAKVHIEYRGEDNRRVEEEYQAMVDQRAWVSAADHEEIYRIREKAAEDFRVSLENESIILENIVLAIARISLEKHYIQGIDAGPSTLGSLKPKTTSWVDKLFQFLRNRKKLISTFLLIESKVLSVNKCRKVLLKKKKKEKAI